MDLHPVLSVAEFIAYFSIVCLAELTVYLQLGGLIVGVLQLGRILACKMVSTFQCLSMFSQVVLEHVSILKSHIMS